MPEQNIWIMIFGVYLVSMSLSAFVMYGADKRKAKRGELRIPELTLLGLSFMGGAAGGYAAMFLFRHKTRKTYFHLVNLLGLLWQAALLFFLILR